MGEVINFELLSKPANWAIIFLVMYLLLLLGSLIWSSAQGYGFPLPNFLQSGGMNS